MLSNSHLLAAINNTIPFITSAPDLTSRLKRRMRMRRGEPVWVKPFREVFPWAFPWLQTNYEYSKKKTKILHEGGFSQIDEPDHFKWARFSEGWLVFLKGRETHWSADIDFYLDKDPPFVKLTIGGFHTQGMVELDILAVMKKVSPEVYSEWLEEPSMGESDSWIEVKRSHLIVKEGLVIAGLTAYQRPKCVVCGW